MTSDAFKAELERLLLDLPRDDANRLMQLTREARGAWLCLLRSAGGRALVVGDPLSGTVPALARAGFAVTAIGADTERLALAGRRDRAVAERAVTRVLATRDRLPFRDGSFELVVSEGSFRDAAELRRVARGEIVLTADNRLGYKTSSGRRGDFRLRRPDEYLLARGERTLGGYRRALSGPGFEATRALALYPHTRDFSLVAALDEAHPRLPIGPKERENKLKMLGYRLGLFPLLAPSFAVLAAREEVFRRPSRIERVLAALAERLGEPQPVAEELIASRGNTAVVHTAAGKEARWTLHVPLSRQQRVQAERHFERTGELRDRFPGVPVPEPLYRGEIEGLFLCCERRIDGLHAPQLVGVHAAMERMYADAARHLAELVVERNVEIDEAVFDELIGAKVELVARTAGSPGTVGALERMQDEARERLLGKRIPRVLYHADLRSKHVMVAENGSVNAYLDWGSSEASDLPYFDLLHLVIHERKQEAGLTAGEAWRLVLEGGLRDFERAALEDYASRVGLDGEVRAAIEALYPVLVGAMAEKNWDYSRPRWVAEHFGL